MSQTGNHKGCIYAWGVAHCRGGRVAAHYPDRQLKDPDLPGSLMEGGQDFLTHNLQLLYGLVAGAQGAHGELGGSGVYVPLD